MLRRKIVLKGEQKKVLFLPSTKPIQIKGVAGSGKTTIALHRAKHLLETQNTIFQKTKIAVFTYSKTLVTYIKTLLSSADLHNVTITTFHKWAYHFAGIKYNTTIQEKQQIALIESIKATLTAPNSNILSKGATFFQEEISWIKGKLIPSKAAYLEAKRTGRGGADKVTIKDKEVIWEVYLQYNEALQKRGEVDFDDYAIKSLEILHKTKSDPFWNPPFTHIIIDEAQDFNKAQILAISKLVSLETESITILADAAQRIVKSGFTWSEVGLNVRGIRTIELKKNYRNSINITRAALSLLNNEADTSDFTKVEAALANGEKPIVVYFENFDQQLNYLKSELKHLKKQENISSTVILHRTNEGLRKIQNYLNNNGFQN